MSDPGHQFVDEARTGSGHLGSSFLIPPRGVSRSLHRPGSGNEGLAETLADGVVVGHARQYSRTPPARSPSRTRMSLKVRGQLVGVASVVLEQAAEHAPGPWTPPPWPPDCGRPHSNMNFRSFVHSLSDRRATGRICVPSLAGLDDHVPRQGVDPLAMVQAPAPGRYARGMSMG